MKKLTSVVLSVLLVVSLFSCLLTGPVSAVASSGELITNGNFESEANTSTGALGCLAWVKIADFNANRAAYAGKWYRATGGNSPSDAPDLLENQTTPGADDYPYYFGRNDQRVAEPGNAGNHVMRAVQTLYQMVAVKENSSYSLSFRFKVPRAEATLNQKMMISLREPNVTDGTKISNINAPALPITSATVSGTNGLSAYIIPDNFAGDKGSIQLSFDGSNSEWQNVTLNFTTGSFYSDALAAEYDEPLIVLHFSWDASDNNTISEINYSKTVTYFDDISLKETVNPIGNAEFYTEDNVLIPASNEYASASLLVNGQPSSTVYAGDAVQATVTYDPNAANTFIGWYNTKGEKVSPEETFSFTAADEKYTPRFVQGNVLTAAGSFENYPAGTSQLVSGVEQAPEGGLWGFCKNAGYDGSGSGAVATVYGAELGAKLGVADAAAHTGNNALLLGLNYRTAFYGFEVEPNTDYRISYDWLANSGKKLEDGTSYGVFKSYIITDYNVQNPGNISKNDERVLGFVAEDRYSDGVTWQNTTILFNSGENTKLYLAIAGHSNGNVSGEVKLALDNLLCAPVAYTTAEITDMKACASVEGVDCDLDKLFIGQNVQFRVIDNIGTASVVTANGKTLTADKNGIYTFRAEAKNTLTVRFTGDENLRDYDKDDDGNDLSAYNEEVYLKSIWEGDTVYQESALFVTGRDTVKLLYPVDEVISLRSYDLQTNYIEGVDYEVTDDGAIKLLSGSRIPVYTGALTTETKPETNAFPLKDGTGYLRFIGDTTYPSYAISVTYKHSQTYEDGYTPAAPVSQNKKLKDTIAKLEAGETVNIAIYGDSISCGWSSSGLNNPNGIYDESNTEGSFKTNYVINVAPYAPTWIDMFLSALQKRYPAATIHLKNLSLGGKDASWGAKNIAARLALWKDAEGNQVTPDLLLVGFGVNDAATNDGAGRTEAEFKGFTEQIIDTARTASGNSDMEVLLYSPMLPNQTATTWDQTKLLGYENALAEIAAADENIGLLKLTSIFTEIVKSKDAVDYLNTNVNHGNDFTARIYATGLLAMFGDAPSAEAPVLEKKTSGTVTLAPVDGYEYSKDGTNWQSSNVFTGLAPETEYTFYQRFAETDATYAGAASTGLQVTTDEPAAFLPGDIDNDGDVDLTDVVALAQVKAGWDIEYVEAALDPNGDGEFDLDDVVYLAQHVAEWEDRALSTVPYVPSAQ